jgi:hypothetical protein
MMRSLMEIDTLGMPGIAHVTILEESLRNQRTLPLRGLAVRDCQPGELAGNSKLQLHLRAKSASCSLSASEHNDYVED